MSARFVRVTVGDYFVWGLQPANHAPELLAIWCEDMDFMWGEFGRDERASGITENESHSIIQADGRNTPDEAWVALAHYRLTGERLKQQ